MKSQQELNFEFFIKNYDDLFEKYGACYLVLKNQEVIASYNSFPEAYENTVRTEKLGDFSIQLCNGNESGYTNYIASCEVFAV